MSYLDRLKDIISEKAPYDQPLKPPEPSFGGLGGDPRGRIPENYAKALLGDWHRHLSALDVYAVPEGFDRNRWGMLVHDCWWLYENFAPQLVREGWSAHDVFGVLPRRRGWGGLADRLQGARNLKLDGEGRAFWSSFGVTFQTCRAVGDSLVSSGLVLVWEIQQ